MSIGERTIGSNAKEPRRTRRECRCRHCGNRFMQKAVDRVTFCSRHCSFEWLAARKSSRAVSDGMFSVLSAWRVCMECGGSFYRSRPRKRCSGKCEKTYNLRLWRAAWKPASQRQIECKRCGKQFMGKHSPRFCVTCRREHEAEVKRSVKSYRKKARKYGGHYEPVSRRAVFERDHWTCQICLGPVDRNASFPDPAAPTIDHIIPQSRQGRHDYANCQCAHMICNSLKSDSTEFAAKTGREASILPTQRLPADRAHARVIPQNWRFD